jgi:pimeloyl-ACP methyl ester carboxylesterase
VKPAAQFVQIDWRGVSVRVELQWIEAQRAGAPLLVFLHEGLGSVAMWKDFPQRLCAAAGCRGLVYSRPGYGRSTPRAEGEEWGPDFMHRQAHEVLPAVLAALAIEHPVWLLGHSDGASIALLYGARWPQAVHGMIVLAPHILVEDLSVASIELARQAYLEQGLKQGLAKYHDDPDSAFWGWNRIWLDPAFRDWSITDEIGAIRCPLLAVQGVDDEYGTMQQVFGISQVLPQTEILALPECGHSPHRDQPERLIAAITDFLQRHPIPGAPS